MHQLKQFIPLILTLLFIGVYEFGIWCDHVTGICDGSFLDKNLYTFKLIYIYSLYSLPATIIIPFVNANAFKLLLKFVIPWLIFSVFIIALIPEYSSLYQPSKEDAAWFMGSLFSAISIILVLVKLFMEKRKNTKT